MVIDSGNSHTLTPAEFQILSTITEFLAPEPEAVCSCVESLDRKLAGPLARLLPAYRQGLAAIDVTCRQQTGVCLCDLEAADRRKFIAALRSGHKLTAFFGLVTGTCVHPRAVPMLS